MRSHLAIDQTRSITRLDRYDQVRSDWPAFLRHNLKPRHLAFLLCVWEQKHNLYHVVYEDNDAEDLSLTDLRRDCEYLGNGLEVMV